MNMQYSTPELSEGRINKQKAEETPNTFATQDGVSKLELSLIHISEPTRPY